MANPNDPVFKIDAGIILAKLHLAGQQAIPNSIPINSGIENPVAKADPKNIGNTIFDLDNKSGQYQFGVLRLLQYQVPLDLSNNKKIKALYEELKKAQEKDNKNSKDKHADDKLTDKTKDEDDKNKSKEVDKNSETYKVQMKILKEFASFKLKNYKENKDDFAESEKSFKEAIKVENEERKKVKEDNLNKLQKDSFKDIKTYFTTFAGQQNSSKIKEDDLVQYNADVDGKTKDPSQFKGVKDFKIETNDIDKAIKKREEEIQNSDKPNDYVQRNILFVIGFTVEVETM